MAWNKAARFADKQKRVMHAGGALTASVVSCLDSSSAATSQPAASHMLQRHCVVKLQ